MVSDKKTIKSGSAFSHLFPSFSQLAMTEVVIKKNATVWDTLREMKKIVRTTLHQTKKLAKKLQGNTEESTIRTVWAFIYQNVQYAPDHPLREQLHTPLRIWHKRAKGVDCDDYAIMASSILTNLGIRHSFRMTDYGSGWQHVYVVVPKSKSGFMSARNSYYVIDPVLNRPDYEKGNFTKHDEQMDLTVLAGVDDDKKFGNEFGGLTHTNFGNEFNDLGATLEGLGAVENPQLVVYKGFLSSLKNHLKNTLKMALSNPDAIPKRWKPEVFVFNLRQLIAAWDNPTERDKALDLYDVWGAAPSGLNGLGSWLKKKVKKAGNFIKKGAKKYGKYLKKVGQGIVKVAKKIGKFILRFNPLSILIRAGLRVAFTLNAFGMAGRLGWGYFTEAQAINAGLDLGKWREHRKTLNKVRGIFEDGLQGTYGNLKSWILKGFSKKQTSPIPISQIGKDSGKEEILPLQKNTESFDSMIAEKAVASQGIVNNYQSIARPRNAPALPLISQGSGQFRPKGGFYNRSFNFSGLNGGLGEVASTSAASGVIAKIVLWIKKIPKGIKTFGKAIGKPLKNLLQKIKDKKLTKQQAIDDLVNDSGMTEQEARQSLRVDKRQSKDMKRYFDREERGGSRAGVLFDKIFADEAVSKKIKQLTNGKLQVTKADGTKVEVSPQDMGTDGNGNPYIKSGATIETPVKPTTAGMSPVAIGGIVVAAAALTYLSKKKAA